MWLRHPAKANVMREANIKAIMLMGLLEIPPAEATWMYDIAVVIWMGELIRETLRRGQM